VTTLARVVFGALVAFIAWYIQFRLFRTNGVIWSLALCSPLVPVLDRVLPGRRFAWADAAVLPLVPLPGRMRRTPSPALDLERIHVS
jgi:predicted acyltransferase